MYKLDRQVVELQRNTQTFTNTGHASHARRVFETDVQIGESLDALRQLIASENEIAIHRQLVEFRAKYTEAFRRLVEDRERRDRLLRGNRLQEEEIRRKLMSRFTQGRNPPLERSAIAFARANRASARYVDSPDSSHAHIAKTALRSIITTLHERGYTDLERLVTEHENNQAQMIQAIRGYLFLNNVVLAGQALEFATNTSELKTLFEAQERALYSELERRNRQAIVFIAICLVGALLVGIFSSALIGRSIAQPLRAITSTFGSLARGETIQQVPGIGRADEIGEMANAAQVFKDKNEQTQDLLEASDSDRIQLAEQGRELKRVNVELEQFAYVASHDLQEPLRMVSSYVGLLRERYEGQLDEEADQFIRFAAEGTGRMQRLIKDLLEFSRAGHLKDETLEPCDTRAILDQVLEDLQGALNDRNAVCSIGELPVIFSNASALRSVFQNFVTNAAKYGKPDVDLILEIEAEEQGNEWIFSFRDNGIGIAPQDQERIFIVFQRLHARSEYDGTGIGLAVVTKLAEQLDGRVWLESELDQGSTFFFSISKRRD